MDNNMEKQPVTPAVEEEMTGYVPRPAWQVWAARIGLVLFIGYMIFYYCRLMGVGA